MKEQCSTSFVYQLKDRFSWLASSRWLALILITITVAVIYSNIYNAPFVLDDTESIIENVEIRDFGYYSSLEQILKPRNIVYLTFAINYKLCGLKVVGYHITNISIHIVNGFLVYLLSLTILKRLNNASRYQCSINLMSIIAALIFVAHPIQTQAITYTVQRFTSMAAMFYMAAIFFYLKARLSAQDPKHNTHRKFSLFYIAAGFCGILAFLSKQNAASLPGAIILVEYLCIDRTWQNWKKIIPWYAFSFILWSIFILYSSRLFSVVFIDGNLDKLSIENLGETITSLSKPYPTSSRWVYLCTQLNVLVIYVRLLFLPINQNIDYMYSFKSGFFDDYTPVAFLFLMGLVVIGGMNIRKRPMVPLVIFWFFITLSVESSIIPVRNAMFEHRLYLPMFGFAIFASWLLFHFLSTDDNPHRQSWIVISYTVIIVSLGAATYHRNIIWQDKIKLWSDAVSKSPKNSRAHNNLGGALLQQGKLGGAIFHLEEAIQIDPKYSHAHNNLGNALLQQNKLEEAIFHYEEALRLKPDNAEAHNNMGNILLRQENLDGALSCYKEAIRIKPDFAKAHNGLGNTLLQQGKLGGAIIHLEEALRLEPDYAEARSNMGNVLLRQGKLDKALSYHKEAIRSNPTLPTLKTAWESSCTIKRIMKKPYSIFRKHYALILAMQRRTTTWELLCRRIESMTMLYSIIRKH